MKPIQDPLRASSRHELTHSRALISYGCKKGILTWGPEPQYRWNNEFFLSFRAVSLSLKISYAIVSGKWDHLECLTSGTSPLLATPSPQISRKLAITFTCYFAAINLLRTVLTSSLPKIDNISMLH